jgi:hypothetical protein
MLLRDAEYGIAGWVPWMGPLQQLLMAISFILVSRGAVNLPFFIIIPVGKAIRKPNKH